MMNKGGRSFGPIQTSATFNAKTMRNSDHPPVDTRNEAFTAKQKNTGRITFFLKNMCGENFFPGHPTINLEGG